MATCYNVPRSEAYLWNPAASLSPGCARGPDTRAPDSIRGGPLRMIDYENFDGALGRLEFQTELLHGGEND